MMLVIMMVMINGKENNDAYGDENNVLIKRMTTRTMIL